MRLNQLVSALGSLLVAGSAVAKNWNVPGDFPTIQAAVDSAQVLAGDRVFVGNGEWAGANITKSVEIRGSGQTTIMTGPLHPAGLVYGFHLLAGSDAASFRNLTFTTDLAIFNRGGADNVIVEHCTFLNSIQAISAWHASGWTIAHNTITDLRTRNGGGIGILVAAFNGSAVNENVVEHNTIEGTLHVDANDGGGYSGTGIVLYADFRFGRTGASDISGNYVVHNKVDLVSDTPSVVDVVAFELTDTRDDLNAAIIIHDNAIGFNDFSGMDEQIAITPSSIDGPTNVIDRNLGENRSGSTHPSAFKPDNE